MNGGSFKASIESAQTVDRQKEVSLPPGYQMPTAKWLRWYDNSDCDKCGKKGHPPKYCGDPGARNRPFKPRACTPGTRHPDSNAKRCPQFKSPSHKREFNKKVHNLLLEATSEKDHELFAHLADEDDGEEPEMYANVVDEQDEDVGEDGVDEEVAAAMAFAAVGLDSLNWKAA